MIKSKEWPAVSVIVCTHKRPELLPRALASVLAQSYDDFEVMVIHDGPADEQTLKVAEEYTALFEKRDINFYFVATEEASGYYCIPRNVAITQTRGDYIAHLDDDNAWYPHTLETLVQAMEEGESWPDFAYGRINYCYHDGVEVKTKDGKLLPQGLAPYQPWNEEATKRLEFALTNFIDASSFIAGRGAYWRLYLTTNRMFNETYKRFGDWELIARAVYFSGWRGKGVDEVVLDYYWGTPNQLQLNRPVHEGVAGVVI